MGISPEPICDTCGRVMSRIHSRRHRHFVPNRKLREKEAKYGFHGYVNKPTHFLVGEAGKERVDIYPIRRRQKRMGMIDDFDFGGGMF